MRESRKSKTFRFRFSVHEKLAAMKVKSGKSETEILEELVEKADAVLQPVDSNPVLNLLQIMNEKLDDLDKKL